MCVLGLGLIGGSIMRAAAAAGREVFGYNRSVEGAHGARSDGFDAITDLNQTLTRAAATEALIVLAVPMPALPGMLAHIRKSAPGCPLTDVTSVKCAVLDEVTAAGLQARYVGGHPMTGTAHSGWTAGHGGLFNRAPWVVSVDDHVDPTVWSMVMTLALDCGAMVVPAKSDEHDAAAAAVSHLPHLLAEALAVTAAEVPLAFALAAGSFRDATRVAATAPDLVRAMCEANTGQLAPAADRIIDLLSRARDSLQSHGSIADLADAGHAARTRYDSFPRSDIVTVVIGAHYDLQTDETGATKRFGLTVTLAERERQLAIARDEENMWLVTDHQGERRAAYNGALDIDLVFSPFFNALPIRRLGLHERAESIALPVVYVNVPEMSVDAATVSYTSEGRLDGIKLRSPVADTTVTVDSDGFIVDYPGLAERM